MQKWLHHLEMSENVLPFSGLKPSSLVLAHNPSTLENLHLLLRNEESHPIKKQFRNSIYDWRVKLVANRKCFLAAL